MRSSGPLARARALIDRGILVTPLRNDAFERHVTGVFSAQETRPDEQTGGRGIHTACARAAEASDEHHQAVLVVSLLADVSEPAGAVAHGGAEGAPLDRAANFAFCDFMNSR